MKLRARPALKRVVGLVTLIERAGIAACDRLLTVTRWYRVRVLQSRRTDEPAGWGYPPTSHRAVDAADNALRQ